MNYVGFFGKFSGIFLLVVLIIGVCFYSFITVKSLITKIKYHKKVKNDEKRLKNEPKTKENVNKD